MLIIIFFCYLGDPIIFNGLLQLTNGYSNSENVIECDISDYSNWHWSSYTTNCRFNWLFLYIWSIISRKGIIFDIGRAISKRFLPLLRRINHKDWKYCIYEEQTVKTYIFLQKYNFFTVVCGKQSQILVHLQD